MKRCFVGLLLCLGVFSAIPLSQASVLRPGQSFGVQDQVNLGMFSDPRFYALHPTSVRLNINWNQALSNSSLRSFTDQWYALAVANHLQPLIVFGALYEKAPSTEMYRKAVKAAIARWPQAAFQAWNEANHSSQPTYHKPQLAADYAKILDKACSHKCLDVPLTVVLYQDAVTGRWVKAFLKAYGRAPKIWAIHTYGDANRYTNIQLKWFMRTFHPKDVWVTETGAWYYFTKEKAFKKPSLARQKKAALYVLDPARLYREVKRIYYFEWQASTKAIWDSALLGVSGQARPAYNVLLQELN